MSTTYRIPGAVLTEREHVVPLVHSDPQRGRISVFTREVAAPDGCDRPYLVFLQGGPGFEATRPTSPPPAGWRAPWLTFVCCCWTAAVQHRVCAARTGDR
jgi:hypothetical protein